jgi:hypothetical protein
MTVSVPTLNDNPRDFDWLFRLWNQLDSDGLEVQFDFSPCHFLRQNAVAFLGGLIRFVEHRHGSVHIDWNSFRPDVAKNLARNGFMRAFGAPAAAWTGNSVPFRQDKGPDSQGVIDYLGRMWLGQGWVQVSNKLRDAIVGRVWEIYENAFEHAFEPDKPNIGIFSCCGQHFPRQHKLDLTVLDFGVGIPSNVRFFSHNSGYPADKALQWAFSPGTTTKPNGMGRGMGLDLLKRFIKLNKGRLEVFSHEGYAVIDENQEKYGTRSTFYEGTLVNICLVCDESFYQLASEVSDEPPMF